MQAVKYSRISEKTAIDVSNNINLQSFDWIFVGVKMESTINVMNKSDKT